MQSTIDVFVNTNNNKRTRAVEIKVGFGCVHAGSDHRELTVHAAVRTFEGSGSASRMRSISSIEYANVSRLPRTWLKIFASSRIDVTSTHAPVDRGVRKFEIWIAVSMVE